MSPETAKSRETKTKLLEDALCTLTEQGIAKAPPIRSPRWPASTRR